MGFLEKLKELLESEEGKKSLTEYAEKLKREDELERNQLQKFHSKGLSDSQFSDFVEKIIAKYRDGKYVDRWYKRGIEPPEDLYWFLYNYAKLYGRECTQEEWKEYSNMFTSALYFVKGYYFGRMDGQGSVVEINKQR